MGGNIGQLGMQVIGGLCILSWSSVWAFLLFTFLRCIGQLRIDKDYENELFSEAVAKMEVRHIKADFREISPDFDVIFFRG